MFAGNIQGRVEYILENIYWTFVTPREIQTAHQETFGKTENGT
jgi:hypothetical protein